MTPRALILAGPNGSGKTTFAREFLTAEGRCLTFLNADLIAAGLSPFEPEKANISAMRLMAEGIRECLDRRVDFSVESTLAGRTYSKLIPEWKQKGYVVKIVFLRLDSPDMAIAVCSIACVWADTTFRNRSFVAASTSAGPTSRIATRSLQIAGRCMMR